MMSPKAFLLRFVGLLGVVLVSLVLVRRADGFDSKTEYEKYKDATEYSGNKACEIFHVICRNRPEYMEIFELLKSAGLTTMDVLLAL